ncbi:MAG: o-succinylbenzoate synthase [Flavobacteriaceae bacterium]
MKAFYFKHVLKFKFPSGTSRGLLKNKESWFIIIVNNNNIGIGECSLISGLSPDPAPKFEKKLSEICSEIKLGFKALTSKLIKFPSILFGLETAFNSLNSADPFIFKNSSFTNGKKFLNINGLIWMGEKSFILDQIQEKINSGFNCIKIKVGALDFKQECEILKKIRSEYSESDIQIRLDANGAFSKESVIQKLEKLSRFKIHSIEQPIGTDQWKKMAFLCRNSPIKIALDEELIGLENYNDQKKMLEEINPDYIIIKPSLLGGIRKSESWIKLAESLKIDWWCTSALESNIGLNVIAQWIFSKKQNNIQGLGTGGLFSNNIHSPYFISDGKLKYNPKIKWELNLFKDYINNYD